MVVVYDMLFPRSVPFLEEMLYDADSSEDLHLLLVTLGGDGETALRIVRQLQARCRELTVLVPDQAKSAGTLVVLGAHCIYMGPTSDLGPVDPQFVLPNGSYAPARAIIAAVEKAEASVQESPAAYPIHAVLLDGLSALLVEQARDQFARTEDLVREALGSVSGRANDDVEALVAALKDPLIEASKSHGAVVSASDAKSYGLPVDEADPTSERWKAVWQLYMECVALPPRTRVYEGETASHTFVDTPPNEA